MIRVDIRQKAFHGEPVLGRISFELAPGETLAITGPSGIGKTTLLRMLAGLDRDFDGQVETPQRKAIVFQEPALLLWRTALENVTLVTGVAQAVARQALADVGLAGLEDRFPGELSMGQQRRLALARAFSAEPEMLLMDEPFVSLDPPLVEEMLGLTGRLLADCRITTCFVTHSTMEAERLSDRILRLTGHPAIIQPGH